MAVSDQAAGLNTWLGAAESVVSDPMGARRQPAKGSSHRCPNCEMSIHVMSSLTSSVCPFCSNTMERTVLESRLPTPEAGDETDAGRASEKYNKMHGGLVLGFNALLVLLITLAIYFKLHNLDYYWYQPWINLYSLSVGVFILSRFILAAFYLAPRDVGFEPTVTVVVACRNEDDSIGKTIGRIYQEGYPHSKLEVVAVNDGSTDRTLDEMMKALDRHPSLVVVDFEKNKGKRHGMAIGALLAKGEMLVYVDSDSFLMPGAIRKVVQGLVDPTVAAVAGHTDVENVGTNALTKMQDVRYFVSYRVLKAAESLFGAVSCCPGCFSAYRKVCVLNVLDRWLYQKFLGHYATFGDDRSLTNYLLRDYRVLYDDEALATTIVPEKWGKYIRQQCRWKRSWVREMLYAGRFMWCKHPVAAVSWYAMTVLPMLAPLVMLRALVWGPIMEHYFPSFYVGGVLVVTLLWSLFYLEKTGRPHWWAGFVFTITYVLFFSWQGYYALATMRKTTWGTR